VFLVGRDDVVVDELTRRLHGERIAQVYSGGAPLLVAAARSVAGALGVGAQVYDGVAALLPGAVPEGLDDLADRHRGEAVVVVGEGRCSLAEWEGDSDGWRLVRLA